MKQKTMKVALILSLAMALALFLGACSGDQETGDQQTSDRQAAQIEIKAPSSGETTIAPGRHFKVSGSLSGGESEPALCEFYNVFPADTLKAGNSYDVTIQAFDRNNAAIEGAACEFTIRK